MESVSHWNLEQSLCCSIFSVLQINLYNSVQMEVSPMEYKIPLILNQFDWWEQPKWRYYVNLQRVCNVEIDIK